MQLEMGISTRRYLPASGTAGLARSLVKGKRRVPCPPPMITESTLLVLTLWRPVCVISDSMYLTADYFDLLIAGQPARTQASLFEPFANANCSWVGLLPGCAWLAL